MMSIFEVGLAISRLPMYWRDGRRERDKRKERERETTKNRKELVQKLTATIERQ